MIVKSAFGWKLGAHALHLETAGLRRTFKVFNNLVTPNATNAITEGNFHVIANTFYGADNGRYIGALALIQSFKATGRFLPFIPGLVSVDLNISSRCVSSSTPTTAVRTSSDAFPKVRWRLRVHLRGLWFPGFGQLKQQVTSGRDHRVYPDDLGKPEPREVAIHKPVFLG